MYLSDEIAHFADKSNAIKAFDLVSCCILLKQLELFKMNMVNSKWIKNGLPSKSQSITTNRKSSKRSLFYCLIHGLLA